MFAENSPYVVYIKNAVGYAKFDRGEYQDALQCWIDVEKYWRRTCEDDNEDLAQALCNIAYGRFTLGGYT